MVGMQESPLPAFPWLLGVTANLGLDLGVPFLALGLCAAQQAENPDGSSPSAIADVVGWGTFWGLLNAAANEADRPDLVRTIRPVMEGAGLVGIPVDGFASLSWGDALPGMLNRALRGQPADKAEKMVNLLSAGGYLQPPDAQAFFQTQQNAGMDEPFAALVFTGAQSAFENLGVQSAGVISEAQAQAFARLGEQMDLLNQDPAAAEAHSAALAIYQKIMPGQLVVAETMYNLAMALTRLRKLAQARPLFEQAYQMHLEALGPWHLTLGVILSGLGDCDGLAGDKAKAIDAYDRALVILERQMDENHPFVRGLWIKKTLLEAKPAAELDLYE